MLNITKTSITQVEINPIHITIKVLFKVYMSKKQTKHSLYIKNNFHKKMGVKGSNLELEEMGIKGRKRGIILQSLIKITSYCLRVGTDSNQSYHSQIHGSLKTNPNQTYH